MINPLQPHFIWNLNINNCFYFFKFNLLREGGKILQRKGLHFTTDPSPSIAAKQLFIFPSIFHMVKKPRVPEVLWRLFSRRARTLADTITSLLPPPDCLCHKRRCLRCSGATPEGFLLRPDDPCHYRQLLTQCYVVISEKASPVSDFSNESRWSQRQVRFYVSWKCQ